MCYMRRDWSFEEEARKLRQDEERRRREEVQRSSERDKGKDKQPVAERVREMVGSR